MEKTAKKPHKYKKGDTLMVKIAAVHEVNGKPAYRIRGIENVSVSEKALDKMRQDRIMPGDTIHEVYVEHAERIIGFDKSVVEDIATKEIKLNGEWTVLNYNELFQDEELAERYAVAQAQEFGYRIVKGGLFGKEVGNGNQGDIDGACGNDA